MEDIDILNKFDNDKLIDVVKNYKRYGYDDELRDYAIHLLEKRGWSREDLQQFGYLTNYDYDEAEKQYKAYSRNSLIGICTLVFSGGILAVVYYGIKTTVFSSLGDYCKFILLLSILLSFFLLDENKPVHQER